MKNKQIRDEEQRQYFESLGDEPCLSADDIKQNREKKKHKLEIGRKGLLEAAELEKGVDMTAGYVEREKPPASIINCGNGIKRCSECGSNLLQPAGTCTICRGCGATIGACG